MLPPKFKKFLKLFFANILGFLAVAIVIEVGGQIYTYFHPAYKIIPFAPHPIIGWRFIPNSDHIVTGDYWYAREFSPEVKINSHGFRDFERSMEKDKNTVRIALLGDSMISARQVDFEKTAGQLLEKRLNKEFGGKTGKKYEVLSFGVDGYGVGQMLLNWDTYASKFTPDFVFLYVFERNYLRTVSSTWCQRGFFGIDNLRQGDSKCLLIRPSIILRTKPVNNYDYVLYIRQQGFNSRSRSLDFKFIEPKTLEEIKKSFELKKHQKILHYIKRLPFRKTLPSDYNRFIVEQEKYLEKEMDGKRMIRKRETVLGSILPTIIYKLKEIRKTQSLENNWKNEAMYSTGDSDSLSWFANNLVNLKTLQVLGGNILNSKSDFIIVDSFQFHSDSVPPTQFSSNWLKNISRYFNFGYIPLYEGLNESREKGNSPRWKYDMHLNVIGNEIFANSMFNYLETKLN